MTQNTQVVSPLRQRMIEGTVNLSRLIVILIKNKPVTY